MTTSYGHDQDAEPSTPDGQEPEFTEADDQAQGDDKETAPDAPDSEEPPD